MGGYRYVIGSGLPTDKVIEQATVDKVSRVAIEGISVSGQLVVIRTRNGYAGGVAYDIDDLNTPYILGTIAGADTVFVALRENAPLDAVFSALSLVIPQSVMDAAHNEFYRNKK